MAITKVSRGLLSTGIVDNSNATAITIDSSENTAFSGSVSISHNSGDSLTLTKTTTEPSLRIEGDTNKDFVLTVSGEKLTITQNDGATDIALFDHDTKATTFTGTVTSGSHITLPATSRLYLDGGGNSFIEETSADTVTITTGNTEAMRIDSNQAVGINMNPNGYGQLSVNSTGVILALRASSGAGQLGFYEGGSGRAYLKTLNGSSGISIIDGNGSTELARFDGNGLKFNGDTASANALDDYEEGTWTPAITTSGGSTSAAHTAADASYTRIGRLVYISAYLHSIQWGDITDGSYVIITGLPFAGDADNYSPPVFGYNNTNIVGGYVENNGNLYLNGSASANGAVEFQQQNNDISGNRFMLGVTLNLNV